VPLDPNLTYLVAVSIAALPLIASVARYCALLIGLLVTLSKASQGDRPEVFREFARAISSCRYECPPGARDLSAGKPGPYIRLCELRIHLKGAQNRPISRPHRRKRLAAQPVSTDARDESYPRQGSELENSTLRVLAVPDVNKLSARYRYLKAVAASVAA